MTRFYTLPCSPDYIIPFGLGARGWVILSSPPSRYTFRTPRVFNENLTCTAWLGIDPSTPQLVLWGVPPNSPNLQRASLCREKPDEPSSANIAAMNFIVVGLTSNEASPRAAGRPNAKVPPCPARTTPSGGRSIPPKQRKHSHK